MVNFPAVFLPVHAWTITAAPGGRGFVVIPARPEAERACAWCYGRPMPGQETCSRVSCITTWDAVVSLDTMSWRGETR